MARHCRTNKARSEFIRYSGAFCSRFPDRLKPVLAEETAIGLVVARQNVVGVRRGRVHAGTRRKKGASGRGRRGAPRDKVAWSIHITPRRPLARFVQLQIADVGGTLAVQT